MIRAVLYALFSTGAVLCSNLNGPVVNTPLGSILGTIKSSRKGFPFYSFRGIRYAEAPVNDLRFRPPVPVKPWNEVFDATTDGPACYQTLYIAQGIPLSEDCLRLNVYTRRISENEDLRPVLFYIHGGSFAIASGQSIFFGPEYLLDYDVVLVTINYRLGTLGFFSTGDRYAPGNYGMKDQVEALRWARDNIRYFGGDPNKITLSGESAGAVSVGLHMISSMSRSLFRSAVILSGGAANSWAVNKNPLPLAQKHALLLNCTTEDTQSMVDCIKRLPAEQIRDIYNSLPAWNTEPLIIMKPVIENENGGIEPFLTKDPVAALQEGDFAQIPVFTGITKDEMSVKAYTLLPHPDWLADLSQNWNRIAPIVFIYEPDDNVSQRLREYYFGSLDQPITNDSAQALGRLYADAHIISGVVRSTKLIADKNTEPVYLFRFSYEGEYRTVLWPDIPANEVPGVVHGDELIYMFYSPRFAPLLDQDNEDARCVDRFTSLITNFMETGNPTPEQSEVLNNVIWTPFRSSNPSYLEVTNVPTLNLQSGIFYEDRIALWESFYPLNR